MNYFFCVAIFLTIIIALATRLAVPKHKLQFKTNNFNIKSFIHLKSVRKKTHGNKIVITIEAMKDEIRVTPTFHYHKTR